MTKADQKRAAMLSQMYPESEGAIRAFHTFMLASADIECRDAIEQSEFIEGVEYFLAMFRPPKSKGGVPDWIAEPLAERNAAYRERALAKYGTVDLTPKQADALVKEVKREVEAAHIAEGSGDIPSDAIRRIRAAGAINSGRHLRRVLPETEDEKKLGQPI